MAVDELLIAQMADMCRRHGLRRLKLGEVEIELAPGEPPMVAEEQPVRALEEALAGAMPPDGDLLFWSTPGPLPSEESKRDGP